MPFKSERQRRYLWAKEPEVAQKWANEAKGSGSSGQKPQAPRAGKKRRLSTALQEKQSGSINLGSSSHETGSAARRRRRK